MAELPNTPTISAIIMMGIACLAVFIVVTGMFLQYRKRKKSVVLVISVAFTFWGLAALATFIGAILSYVYYKDTGPIAGAIQYSRYGINLGYLFSAISNIFIVYFGSEIFSQFPIFRRTKKVIPISHAILNGITIGLVINLIIGSFTTTELTEKYNPNYPIGQTVYHLILTFLAFFMLLVFSTRAKSQASLRWEKAGFSFIRITAIFAILIYVSFALDLIVQEIWSTTFSQGYTFFNHIGWLFAVIMVSFAYIGFFMPKWIREKFKQPEEN